MKNLLITIIVLTSIGINAFAQNKSHREKCGDKYYFVYSFNKAIDAYNDTKDLTLEGQRRLAKSYHNVNNNSASEATYAKLLNTSGGNLPEDYYNYAMLLKSEGKYDESNKMMDKFNELKPDDLRAKDYVNNKGELTKLMKDEGKFKTEHLKVNTDAEDFGTCYYKNSIIFASSRTTKVFPKKSNWTGKPYLNMYVSQVDGTQLKDPVAFDKDLIGKMNDGPASFSKDGNYMSYTRNNYDVKRRERVIKLEIYFRTYKDGKWLSPEGFALNNKDYSVGHPALSADGKTMYFTSDMPGGYGGTDIYKVTKDVKGQWGKAENMGDKINTEGDEMFPFYNEEKGILSFSSNGRFGLGGLDIFISEIKDNKVVRVYNAGAPLNTQFDDFALIGDEKLSKGYLSSNRSGGSGDDDIYSVDFMKTFDTNKKVEGIAKDKNGTAIPRTFITLLNDNGGVIDTVTTKDDGVYTFSVDGDKNFKLTGAKTKYTEGDTLFNTFGKDFIVKADVILLTKEEVVEKKIQQPNADLAVVLELGDIYFDLDKYNIRPDAKIELNKIVGIMNKYPDMVVELGAYTDCRESKEYNQLLSDRRAKASTTYIKQRITKPSRITGKGYGKTKLVNSCTCDDNIGASCSEQEHQQNRRSEFTIKSKPVFVPKHILAIDK